ncbi:MAG: TetR/AcrR family transcriptional regulator [Deltaproteobacteria bacterium]|nr:TetR/AcrR family transcriptional regulator [Deltaproteobacteria bacterium]
MARYSSEHKAQSHGKILAAAALLFRKNGFSTTGVDAIMSRAGMTAGAFYAHFDSKADLFSQALARATAAGRSRLLAGLDEVPKREWFAVVVKRYLSAVHRDDLAQGCAVPPLVSELARADRPVRKVFDRYVEDLVAAWAKRTPGTAEFSASDRALATFCLMVGGISLARAVHSKILSDRILKACRKLALGGVEK